MRLEYIVSLRELRHGDRIRLTLNRHFVPEGRVALLPDRPELLYICQNSDEYLDGGHPDAERSVGCRYAWAVYIASPPRDCGIRGLRRIRANREVVERRVPLDQLHLTVTETVMPDGRIHTEREVTFTAPCIAGGPLA